MKIFHVFFLFIAIQPLAAQTYSSEQIDVILLIQNEHNEPLTKQEVIVQNEEQIFRAFTKSTGRVVFRLQRGDTYTVSFLDFENFTSVHIPEKGKSFLTKKITFPTADQSILKDGVLDTVFQNYTLRQQPTQTETVFNLMLKDRDRKAIANETVWMVQPEIKKAYQAKTNKKGMATFLLPAGYTYNLDFINDKGYKSIKVPQKGFLRQKKGVIYVSSKLNIQEVERNDTIFQEVPLSQKATRQRVLISVTITDLDDQPLADEKVFMRTSKEVYTATTDKNGKTALILPKGETYTIKLEYSNDLEDIELEKGNYLRNDKISYQYIGSAVIKARELEQARRAKRRDSLMQIQAFRDSLNQKRSKWSGFIDKINNDFNKDSLLMAIYNRVKEDSIGLAEDPEYFERIGDEVNAALQRNKDKWKNKIIVTDLTCSMYPYMDQVLVWHALEMNEVNLANEYIFFNDGDGKPVPEKIMGQTGGFYYIQSKLLDELTWTMLETMQTGCSIDGPENDLEALLEAVKYQDQLEEIILIADNSSPVRDIELLTQLNVPVRIILAGVWYDVNEDYLDIAYHTKGSIHTLEQDLNQLYQLKDGESIKIGENTYRIYQGKFVKMARL
ncbi:MAG: hypothetical protein MK226_19935 [Saprospiraceae bacterium]|nr:hypothetical protein [Saprospiraceae bacterium]